MIRLGRSFDTAWVGGDISRAERLFISIALLGEGEIKKIVRRKGARPGDLLYVTGKLGGSLEGRHLTFTPRLRESQFLVNRFHPRAMIDLSDGFIQDLGHLLKASRAGARIDLSKIPISEAAWRRAEGGRKRAVQSALTDGEDFELLFALPSGEGKRLEKEWRGQFGKVPLTRVGKIAASPGGRIGWHDAGKKLKQLWFDKKGFAHF